MTRDECAAAVLLCDALSDMDDLAKELEEIEPADGYRARGFLMGCGDISDAGGSCEGTVHVDIETGRLIFAAARRIITQRIHDLGVTLES